MQMLLKKYLFVVASCIVIGLMSCNVRSDSPNSRPPSEVPGELNAYLCLPDDSYAWKIVESQLNTPSKSWLVELTSQTWHGITWKHYMIVIEPEDLQFPHHGILFINGSRNGIKPGIGDRALAELLASNTGSYVTLLFQVPNQPLFDNLTEDALISETLVNAIADKDTTWPLLFPMTKSAIRALDATQELIKKERNQEVEKFVITGASKRGWTTWLTGASGDSRVLAIAPMVIDMLNIQKQMKYQLETWGDWSASIHDYTDRKLLDQSPEKMDDFRKQLWQMIDPYYYRSRLTMPKLLIHGTNDPYWTVDASQHYWDDLSGTKYILTLPNVGHDLGNEKTKALLTLATFARYAFDGGKWPQVTWSCSENQKGNYELTIKTDIPSVKVKLWTAHSETKEFRKAMWSSKDITLNGNAQNISVEIEKPLQGHVAFFVELESDYKMRPFSVTTQVWRK